MARFNNEPEWVKVENELDPKLELTPAFALKDAKEVIVQIRKKQ